MKEFRDKDGLMNRVCRAKVWANGNEQPFETIQVRYTEPHPEIDPEDPYWPFVLAEPSKMPETESEFQALIANGLWVPKRECFWDGCCDCYHVGNWCLVYQGE